MTEAGVVVDRRQGYVVGRLGLPAALAVVVVLLDQATKSAIAGWLGRGESRHRQDLIDPFAALEYVENTGAAFGVLRGESDLLTAVALAVVFGLVIYYLRTSRPTVALALSLGLLVGGAFGNLIDRVRLGYVVDFVAIGVWPKFNLADTAVTIGTVLLVWHMLARDRASAAAGGAAGEGA